MNRRVVRIAPLLLLLASAGLGQNLVAGGTFDTSLEAWHHDPNDNGSSDWSFFDAAGSPSSGSAFLTSTNATGGAPVTLLTTCVPVAAGQQYVLSADVRFSAGETTTGGVELALAWTPGAVCQGFISGNGFLTPVASRGDWVHGSSTFTAPAGATSALVAVAIDKIEAGGELSAFVDNVSLAPAGVPTDTRVGWLPVVGSLTGNFDSLFRTSFQMLNPNAAALSGRLIFHPAGQPASDADPYMGYSLGPGQSFSWYDVVAAMGLSGLGSLDVTWSPGLAPPIVVPRIFDDGIAGTSGFTEPMFEGPDQTTCCPVPGLVAYLLPPSDLQRYRYNVGVRVIYPPITMTVEVLDPAGTVVHTATRTYPEAVFEQTTAAEFAGEPLETGQTLKVTASTLWVIVYGATVDNLTNDPSAQFLSAFWTMQP